MRRTDRLRAVVVREEVFPDVPGHRWEDYIARVAADCTQPGLTDRDAGVGLPSLPASEPQP